MECLAIIGELSRSTWLWDWETEAKW